MKTTSNTIWACSIRLGTPACADIPTIDLAVGPVGEPRRLDTSPQTALVWQWRPIRIPANSLVLLSADNVRNPTFVPDVAELYVFRLYATNAGATCIRTLSFRAVPGAPAILVNDGNFGVRSNHFGFNLSASANQVVIMETSTNLVNWTALVTNTVIASPFYFSDPSPPNSRYRFYRAVSR